MIQQLLLAMGGGWGSNAIVSGGVVLLIATFLMNHLRLIGGFLFDYISRRFFVEIELHPREDAHRWVITYTSENKEVLAASQTHRVLLIRDKSRRGINRQTNQAVTISNPLKIIFAPGESAERDHVFRLGNVVHSNDSSSDSIKLWAPGRSGARERLESFIADAMLYAISKDKEKTIVYSFVHSSHWVRTHSRAKRSFQSVILPAEMVEDFKNDIGSFFGRSELYEGLGIPYRRSYLLHGPPGCGKTSFVTALAGEYGLHICVLNLGDGNFSDSTLNSAMHSAPRNAIILLEDIDSTLPKRAEATISKQLESDTEGKKSKEGPEKEKPKTGHQVTFSGILNAIDGIASQESRIIIMTTNVLKTLDPALTRPGRVDRVFKFDLATPDQARRLFLRFHPKEVDLSEKFASLVEPGVVSMAALQGLLMQYANDPLATYTKYASYLDELKCENRDGVKLPESKQ